MNKALAVALIAAVVLTAGCASREKREARQFGNPAPCPNALVLADAARQIEFDGEAELENVAYSAEILDISLTCRYTADNPIRASLSLDFAFGRGPKGLEEDKTFTYFVAVTRTDLEVIEKAEFTIPVRFSDREAVRTAREKIGTIVIPRAHEETSGLNFEIVVGFSLTPQQAIYNRSGKSLKFPDLQ